MAVEPYRRRARRADTAFSVAALRERPKPRTDSARPGQVFEVMHLFRFAPSADGAQGG